MFARDDAGADNTDFNHRPCFQFAGGESEFGEQRVLQTFSSRRTSHSRQDIQQSITIAYGGVDTIEDIAHIAETVRPVPNKNDNFRRIPFPDCIDCGLYYVSERKHPEYGLAAG